MSKILSLILIAGLVLGLTGCIDGDRNRSPSVAEISCPATAKTGESVAISVKAYDPNGDRIAYKVAFGDGIQSEWSDYLPSGQAKIFHHTFDKEGVFGVYAIASDRHKNSGWSEKTFIEIRTPTPNSYEWIRGLLTLNPLPTAQKTIDLGFNLIIPFANLPSGWSSKGKIIARHIGNETGVIGYNIEDEPDCRKWNPERMLEEYREMKAGTSLPVGCLLCGDIGCGIDTPEYTKKEWQQKWIEAGNQVDFLILDVYPYRKPECQGGRTPLEEMEHFHRIFQETVTVPIIVCIQAHNTYPDQIRPNPLEQVKFWVERGYGYVVYPWNNAMTVKPNSVRGVIDMEQEWKAANEWAKSQVE